MKKYLCIAVFSISTFQYALAQQPSVKDLYFDFTNYRMSQENKEDVLRKSLILLSQKNELTVKQQANVNYHIGRLYEETGAPEKSVPYYEETIALSPAYYVPYRALAFINVKKCNEFGVKINDAAKQKNAEIHNQALADYKKQVLKTIPYLEKAQACDPDDETLTMLVKYYKSIKANEALEKLPEKLKKLAENCITLLDDE